MAPSVAGLAWRQILSLILTRSRSLVAPLLHLDELIDQVLLVQDRRAHVVTLRVSRPLPRGDVGVLVVVTQRLAVLGLRLPAEVPAAGLAPVQGVDAHQL